MAQERPYSEVVNQSNPRFPESLKTKFISNFSVLKTIMVELDKGFYEPIEIRKGYFTTSKTKVSYTNLDENEYASLIKCYSSIASLGNKLFNILNKIPGASSGLLNRLISRDLLRKCILYLKKVKEFGQNPPKSCSKFTRLIEAAKQPNIKKLLSDDTSERGFPYFLNIFNRDAYKLKDESELEGDELGARNDEERPLNNNQYERKLANSMYADRNVRQQELARQKQANQESETTKKEEKERANREEKQKREQKAAANKAEREQRALNKQKRTLNIRKAQRNILPEGSSMFRRWLNTRRKTKEIMDEYDRKYLETKTVEKARTAAELQTKLEQDKRGLEATVKGLKERIEEIEALQAGVRGLPDLGGVSLLPGAAEANARAEEILRSLVLEPGGNPLNNGRERRRNTLGRAAAGLPGTGLGLLAAGVRGRAPARPAGEEAEGSRVPTAASADEEGNGSRATTEASAGEEAEGSRVSTAASTGEGGEGSSNGRVVVEPPGLPGEVPGGPPPPEGGEGGRGGGRRRSRKARRSNRRKSQHRRR